MPANDTYRADWDLHIWVGQCRPARPAACCAAWSTKVRRAFELVRHQSSAEPPMLQRWNSGALGDAQNSRNAYDLLEPTWSCESRERVPSNFGYGPKWVCGLRTLKSTGPAPPCLVYSFGSNGDVSFEQGVKAAAPNCHIFTFDPTLSAEKLAVVRGAEKRGLLKFVDVGLGDRDTAAGPAYAPRRASLTPMAPVHRLPSPPS